MYRGTWTFPHIVPQSAFVAVSMCTNHILYLCPTTQNLFGHALSNLFIAPRISSYYLGNKLPSFWNHLYFCAYVILTEIQFSMLSALIVDIQKTHRKEPNLQLLEGNLPAQALFLPNLPSSFECL